MKLFDTLQQLLGMQGKGSLHAVTEQDHQESLIKERPDLCQAEETAPMEQTVSRDNARDIIFLGWQIANVEERHAKDSRRLAYLKLFRTRNDKYVCQRMTLIDDEEKHYQAVTVDDMDGVRQFFGNDRLAQALYQVSGVTTPLH